MALQGFKSSLAITGAATTFTNETATYIGALTYQIDDSTKEIFDPETSIVVTETIAGVPNTVSASEISNINLLHGKVTFTSARTGTIDFSGKYLPRTVVANAFQLTINKTKELLPNEKFGDTSKKKITGLFDASGDVSIRDVADTTVGGGDSIADLFANGTPFVLSFLPASGADTIRARVLLESIAIDGDVAGQVIDNISWQCAKTKSVDGFTVNISTG